MDGKFRIKGYKGDIEALRLKIEDNIYKAHGISIIPKLSYQNRSNSECIYFSILVDNDEQLREVMRIADEVASQDSIVLTMLGH